uniref:VENN motif pre-toxin domain-containing protein n=1 Tax=Xanthomonas sacchari TaxID=56458 RepID=UPI003527300E
SGNDSTTTRATLTEGNITIGGKRTTAAETGINTDASKANEALATLPDVRKVLAEQQAMGAAAGTVLETSRQVAGDIAASAAKKTAEARDAYLKGLNSDEQEAFAKLDPTAQQNVLLSQSTAYSDAYAKEKQWGTGGEYNRALQAVTTALVGGVSGQSGTQVASNALAPYAAQLIGQTFDSNHGSDPNKSLQLLSHALLGAVLAEANGNSAVGGALTGAGGEAAAQYLTKTLYGADTKPSDLSEQDKQTILALSQAVGALVGGMTGGSLSDAAVGSTVAKNAVENNWLSREEINAADTLRSACDKAGGDVQACKDGITREIDAIDVAREKEWIAYQGAVAQEVSQDYMAGAGWTREEYKDEQLNRQSTYWTGTGITEDQAIFSGYKPAQELGYLARSAASSAFDLAAFFARPGMDVTADLAKGTWSGLLNAGGALKNYSQAPLPALYMQYGISGSLTMTTEERARLLVATAAGLAMEGVVVKGLRVPDAATDSLDSTSLRNNKFSANEVKREPSISTWDTDSEAGAPPVVRSNGQADAASGSRLKPQLIAEEVANGHAYQKHVVERGEFIDIGVTTKKQFQDFIENIVADPTIERRQAVDGTTYYLDYSTKTIVIRGRRGEATAFRPDVGGVGWEKYLKTQVPNK